MLFIIIYTQLRDNHFNIPFFYYFCTILSTIYLSPFYALRHRQMSVIVMNKRLFHTYFPFWSAYFIPSQQNQQFSGFWHKNPNPLFVSQRITSKSVDFPTKTRMLIFLNLKLSKKIFRRKCHFNIILRMDAPFYPLLCYCCHTSFCNILLKYHFLSCVSAYSYHFLKSPFLFSQKTKTSPFCFWSLLIIDFRNILKVCFFHQYYRCSEKLSKQTFLPASRGLLSPKRSDLLFVFFSLTLVLFSTQYFLQIKWTFKLQKIYFL